MRVVQVYKNYTRISVTNSEMVSRRETKREREEENWQPCAEETTTMHATTPQNHNDIINILSTRQNEKKDRKKRRTPQKNK